MSAARTKGIFWTLEGIDGSGTTTQTHQLVGWLEGRGENALFTCEPTGGRIGKLLRSILRGEESYAPAAVALLFAADRLDHVEREIAPARERGLHVICDRYVYSSLAYQSLGEPLAWVAGINAQAPEPDLTVYLRVPAETAAERRAQRGEPDELYDALALQRAIAARYDDLLGATPADGDWHCGPDGWRHRPSGRPRQRQGAVAILDGEAPLEQIQARLRDLWTIFRESETT